MSYMKFFNHLADLAGLTPYAAYPCTRPYLHNTTILESLNPRGLPVSSVLIL